METIQVKKNTNHFDSVIKINKHTLGLRITLNFNHIIKIIVSKYSPLDFFVINPYTKEFSLNLNLFVKFLNKTVSKIQKTLQKIQKTR